MTLQTLAKPLRRLFACDVGGRAGRQDRADEAHQQWVSTALAAIQRDVTGKDAQVRLALVCLLAGGHLLLEDVPGVGKTTLAASLAHGLGLEFKRVQFTSDLLPAELTGSAVYDPGNQTFNFQPGPLFTQALLGDELNRASPKTQSALLEAMAEGRVSVDGITRSLEHPFFVIATQNPSHQQGTYPLPESQLDRFMMSLTLGYPDATSEMRMLQRPRHRTTAPGHRDTLSKSQLVALQAACADVHVSEEVAAYAYRVIRATRTQEFREGLSPRAGMAWMRASQAWAYACEARTYVTPDDLIRTFSACARHRIALNRAADGDLDAWLARIEIYPGRSV